MCFYTWIFVYPTLNACVQLQTRMTIPEYTCLPIDTCMSLHSWRWIWSMWYLILTVFPCHPLTSEIRDILQSLPSLTPASLQSKWWWLAFPPQATGDPCCIVCGKKTGKIAECHHCPRAIHLDCLDPPLPRMPRKWVCPACTSNQVSVISPLPILPCYIVPVRLMLW